MENNVWPDKTSTHLLQHFVHDAEYAMDHRAGRRFLHRGVECVYIRHTSSQVLAYVSDAVGNSART